MKKNCANTTLADIVDHKLIRKAVRQGERALVLVVTTVTAHDRTTSFSPTRVGVHGNVHGQGIKVTIDRAARDLLLGEVEFGQTLNQD